MFNKGDVVRLVEDGNGYVSMVGELHGYIGVVTEVERRFRHDEVKGPVYSPCAAVRMLATGKELEVIWFTQMEKADVQEG